MITYQHQDFTILHYAKLDSTNKQAIELLQQNIISDKAVIVADTQQAGIGKSNRHWHSPHGNLYCSIVLQIEQNQHRLTQLALITAVALGNYINKLQNNIVLHYKWPNDVLLSHKKVAGILLTSTNLWQNYQAVIIGIGVNINSHPTAVSFTATDLQSNGINIDCQQFLCGFLSDFYLLYQNWLNFGFANIKKLWLAKAYCLGQEIAIKNNINGIFVGIDDDGNINIKGDKNNIKIASCDW